MWNLSAGKVPATLLLSRPQTVIWSSLPIAKPSNQGSGYQFSSAKMRETSVVHPFAECDTLFPVPKKRLSHYDRQGRARMVDVSAKSKTAREAEASAFVVMKAGVLRALPNN